MKKLLTFLVIVLLLASGSAKAEEEKGPLNGPQRLLKIIVPDSEEDFAQAMCGEYLISFPAEPSSNLPSGLGYQIQVTAPPSIGGYLDAWLLFPRTKFRVVLDDTKRDITAELLVSKKVNGKLRLTDGNVYIFFDHEEIDAIVLRMSHENYSKSASCLPKPALAFTLAQ